MELNPPTKGDLPADRANWINSHYHWITSGTNTGETDMRKPVKLKPPKSKPKFRVRPNLLVSQPLEDVPSGAGPPAMKGTLKSATTLESSSVKPPGGGDTHSVSHKVTAEEDSSTTLNAKWTIILLCTEPNSRMHRHNPFPGECKIVEITKEDDFTSESGYNKVVEALRGPNVVLFASLPCTGGCPWQLVNRKHPGCRRLLEKHHRLFDMLFGNLLRLTREFAPRGTIPIIFEWPRPCRYWKLPKVEQFIEDNDLVKSRFDGCVFGLRSILRGEEHKYLRKPWCIATNIPEVYSALDGVLCPGVDESHQHGTSGGKNTRHTQGYTEALVITIHQAVARSLKNFGRFW